MGTEALKCPGAAGPAEPDDCNHEHRAAKGNDWDERHWGFLAAANVDSVKPLDVAFDVGSESCDPADSTDS